MHALGRDLDLGRGETTGDSHAWMREWYFSKEDRVEQDTQCPDFCRFRAVRLAQQDLRGSKRDCTVELAKVAWFILSIVAWQDHS